MGVTGNLVWFDENQNGIQDLSESVAEGVDVTAFDVQTGIALRTTTTDQNGLYELDYLEKGIYLLNLIYLLIWDNIIRPYRESVRMNLTVMWMVHLV